MSKKIAVEVTRTSGTFKLTDASAKKTRRACGKADCAANDLNRAAKALRSLGFPNEADRLDALAYAVVDTIHSRVLPECLKDESLLRQLMIDALK